MKRRLPLLLCVVALEACGDPADFRPAKGVADSPPAKTAYRVHDSRGCEHIGFVKRAESVDDVAETVANHGGTHFQILDDDGGESLEVGWISTAGGGSASAHKVKHHLFTAEAYRCR